MYTLRIALRYLFAKKTHNAVNIISVVSMIGVAVAAAAIVCVLSVFNGFTELSLSHLSDVAPDLRVTPARGKTVAGVSTLIARLTALPEVGSAVPAVDEGALAVYRNRQMPVRLLAAGETAGEASRFARHVIDSELLDSLADGGGYRCAALSVGVASRLGARPGFYDWLGIYAPRRRGHISIAAPLSSFVTDSLVVSAVYETQDMESDASTIVVPLDVARRLLDYGDEASSIDITLSGGVDADAAARSVSAALGDDYRVLTRLQQHEGSFRMISIEKWITFAMLAFILLIASFNVVSTLSMLIIEKDDNIAVLRAMGATPAQVRRIFVIEGWLITMSGAVIGVAAGVVLALAQQLGGFIKLAADPSTLTVTSYPVRLEVPDLLVILLLTAVVGWLVGFAASLFVPRSARR